MKRSRLVSLVLLASIAALSLGYKYFEHAADHRRPGAADGNAPESGNDGLLHGEADEYALAYGLSPLRPGSANELRLWFIEPMEGGISGAVFSENGALKCEGLSQHGRKSGIPPGRDACRKMMAALSSDDLATRLHSLSELVDEDASCGDPADGWGITVQGVVEGRRFAFQAWNPDRCDNAEARKLYRLLEDLDRLIAH